MFIPLHDSNHLRSIQLQYVTFGLIAVNVIVYLVTTVGGERVSTAAVLGLGFIPSVVYDTAELPAQFIVIPERLSYLTYAFLHADIFHLGGNMLFLWVFGDNVEDALGHFRFVIFYLACGVVGGLTHTLMMPTSELPLIGASGAVAGVIAAYLMLHPRVRIWVLVMRVIPIRISAAFALGAWIVTQLIMVLLPQVGPVAWWAHIGGLAAGAVLVVFMRRSGVPLFDRGIA